MVILTIQTGRALGLILCAGMVIEISLAKPKLPGCSAAPSNSKLGIHLDTAYTTGAAAVINAHPRIIKIFFPCVCVYGPQVQAARDYKAGTPAGKVVLRIYTTQRFSISDDPTASATSFWNNSMAPAINAMAPADRALIDYLEGPNEGDNTPTFESIAAAQWFNTFWLQLAPLIGEAGMHPLFGSIAVGNPGGDPATVHAMLDAIVPALRKCKSLGGGWGYHDYSSPAMTKDVGVEIWYSLRYRQYYSYFQTNYPDLNDLLLVGSEGGGYSGWTGVGAACFEDWLAWHDQQIQQDSYFIGDTLFEIGDPGGWHDFDLEPIAGWLADYIASAVPPGPPSPPTGLVATPGNTEVSLTWTGSTGATGYNVKRSTTAGGPYTDVATGLTTTLYINTGLTNGVTYYYVVTAQNFYGESGVSNESVAIPTDSVATESFETMPAWASSFDASWGSSATWSIASGGQWGNALQATRAIAGSSARVQVYSVTPDTDYTLSIYIKCPSYSANAYWAECAFKSGNNSASDFDGNPDTWTVIQKMSDTGTNGNGNTWARYSTTFNSGANTQLSLGIKLGSLNGGSPTVSWDTFLIAPPPPVIFRSPGALAPSCRQRTDAPSQSFTVQNTGSGTLNYSISDDAAWLNVNPDQGTSAGELDTITVNYTSANLAIGTCNATITIRDISMTAVPQMISVTLNVHPIPGDLTHNGTVDSSDFSIFRGCITGPNSGPPTSGCVESDFDDDGDVDQSDFGILQRCLSGSGIPADPRCTS